MGLRVRQREKDKQYREIVCAAENPPMDGDDYLDETMHSSILRYAMKNIIDSGKFDRKLLAEIEVALIYAEPGLCYLCKENPSRICERCDAWGLKCVKS